MSRFFTTFLITIFTVTLLATPVAGTTAFAKETKTSSQPKTTAKKKAQKKQITPAQKSTATKTAAPSTASKKATPTKTASAKKAAKSVSAKKSAATKVTTAPSAASKKVTPSKSASTTKVTKSTSAKKQVTASKKQQKNKKRPTKTARRQATVHNYKGAILYNSSAKKIVFSDKANVRVPPASLTKILSMYVAHDLIKARKLSLQTKVTVSNKAAATGGSRMGLKKGDKVTLEQLLYGMAISSGNDASVALAEYFGKTEAGFVAMMNKKARQIGMTSSTFKNAHGLPAVGQYSTAKDMLALATNYLKDYPSNLDKYHKYRTYDYGGHITGNANPLLGQFNGADGLKTGYVTAAGYNLIATTKRDNVRLIGVILGAPSSSVRQRESAALMEAGYGKYACAIPPANQQAPKTRTGIPQKTTKKKELGAKTPKKNLKTAAAPTKKTAVRATKTQAKASRTVKENTSAVNTKTAKQKNL